jgi:hypothetical protein
MTCSKRKNCGMMKQRMDRTIHNLPRLTNLLLLVGASLGRALTLSRELLLVLVKVHYA